MNKEHENLQKDVDELTKKFDNRYEPRHKTESSAKKSKTNRLVGVGVIIIAIIIILWSIRDIDEFQPIKNLIFGKEVKPSELLTPSEVELYRFSDLHSNISVNVELWLINLGETTAKNIGIYVRVRNQDGIVLLSDEISPTVLVLRYNETTSAIYSVSISDDDIYVLHTIEIEWDSGRTAYCKKTIF